MHRSKSSRVSPKNAKSRSKPSRSISRQNTSIMATTIRSTSTSASHVTKKTSQIHHTSQIAPQSRRSSAAVQTRRTVSTISSDGPKTAIVMLNMGGPEDPADTQTFLENLFTDSMIIDLGRFQSWGKKFAARRAKDVQKQYETIGGSPIRKWTDLQGRAFTKILDVTSPSTAPHKHYIAFRYANPLTEDAITQMKNDGITRAIAFSQYPMYSCTTTGSSLTYLFDKSREMGFTPQWSVIDRWHNHPGYIESLVKNIQDQVAQVCYAYCHLWMV